MIQRDIMRPVAHIATTLAVVISISTAVLILARVPPLQAYHYLITGSLGSWQKLAQVFQVWIPLTLSSCGLLYTFRIRLWNIGVEGQVMMGAVGATLVLRSGATTGNPLVFIALAVLAGALLGGIWALFAGVLKTWGGVHEIFAGLGLNFVAQGLILWLIFGPWKRPGIASMSGTEPFPPILWLPTIAGWRVSPYALLLCIMALIISACFFRYTRTGLAFKAVGRNPRSSYLFGLKPARYMVIAMALGGALAGLAGVFQVLSVYHRLIPAISSNYGYLALLVVMLANYKLIWVPLITFFFAALNVGSIQLPMMLHIDSSLGGVIQGALVLAALLTQSRQLRQRLKRL